jgi:hypothetical protein
MVRKPIGKAHEGDEAPRTEVMYDTCAKDDIRNDLEHKFD